MIRLEILKKREWQFQWFSALFYTIRQTFQSKDHPLPWISLSKGKWYTTEVVFLSHCLWYTVRMVFLLQCIVVHCKFGVYFITMSRITLSKWCLFYYNVLWYNVEVGIFIKMSIPLPVCKHLYVWQMERYFCTRPATGHCRYIINQYWMLEKHLIHIYFSMHLVWKILFHLYVNINFKFALILFVQDFLYK